MAEPIKMKPPAPFGIGTMNDPEVCKYCGGTRDDPLEYEYEASQGVIYMQRCRYIFHPSNRFDRTYNGRTNQE